jgi:hypothetical protein
VLTVPIITVDPKLVVVEVTEVGPVEPTLKFGPVVPMEVDTAEATVEVIPPEDNVVVVDEL